MTLDSKALLDGTRALSDEGLLPCPFCGGEAKRHTIGDEEPNNAGGDVICCTVCQASSHVEFGRKENLKSRWNTRATRPPVKGDSVELVERDCRECNGSGDAEYIGGYSRPCDACNGEGTQTFTAIEAGLLDQIEAMEAGHTALSERVVVLEEERDGYMAALRWVYENGLPHDSKRPDFVNRAFSDAFAPVRAALKGCDALGGGK